jgi:O-antigen ligase
MDTTTGTEVLNTALSGLLSPVGLAGALAALILALAALSSRGCRWAMLALALWMTTFGLTATAEEASLTNHVLWGPLELLRHNGRLLASGMLIVLLLASIFAGRGWRFRLIAGAAVAFLALEFAYCARLFASGLTVRAASSVAVFLLIFIILSRGVSAWLQEPKHALALLRSVALAGMIFAGVNALQLLINPQNASWDGRLNGTAGNPQHMAIDTISFLPAILFLLLRKGESKALRAALAGCLGLMAIMLGLTQSRTGALMAVVAVVVMFRRRLGKFLAVAVIGCIATFVAMLVFPDAPVHADRFVSMEDTRSAIWGTLIGEFASHPIFGIINGEPGIRESSYLSIAARLGIVGLMPMLFMIVLALLGLRKLSGLRQMLGENEFIVDVVTAGLASLAVAALSEGFVLGTLTLQVYMIYLYFALMTFLTDLAEKGWNVQAPLEGYEQPIYEEYYFPIHDL